MIKKHELNKNNYVAYRVYEPKHAIIIDIDDFEYLLNCLDEQRGLHLLANKEIVETIQESIDDFKHQCRKLIEKNNKKANEDNFDDVIKKHGSLF